MSTSPPCGHRRLRYGCSCGNREPLKIKRYVYKEEFMGILCEKCKVEWLVTQETGHDDNHIQFGNYTLRKNTPEQVKKDAPCDISPDRRTRISDVSELQEGDHFAFHRPYLIWHHGIVVNVDKSKDRFEVGCFENFFLITSVKSVDVMC